MDNFFDALEMLSEENNVEIDLLIDKIKSAMLKAAKRVYPHSEERLRVEIDTENKKFAMYIVQEIIDDEPIDENEINIKDALLIDKNAVVGGTILKQIDISGLGRMAALSAKQTIKGDLRDINKAHLLEKFEKKEHECINATVTQIDPGRGSVTVVHSGTELYLSKNEQIPGETFTEGKIIKVYVTGIVGKTKKPIVKISRTHKDLVKRLFEMEVPEIYDGTVEIKSISREAGSRTKIAVFSNDSNVDAVGACIGPKRSRITAVVNELNGEKIDIIPWSQNAWEFIAKALAPAEVLKTVITSYVDKTCTVVVPNNQLSLAIGNKGQNAKLAAKLTGYKIDIKPQTNPLTGEEAPELSDDFACEPLNEMAETAAEADINEDENTEAVTAEATASDEVNENAPAVEAENAEAENSEAEAVESEIAEAASPDEPEEADENKESEADGE